MTVPGPYMAPFHYFGIFATGLFRGFLREVSRKNATLRRIGERAILHGEKPACSEPVSFEDRWLPQGSAHGRGFTSAIAFI